MVGLYYTPDARSVRIVKQSRLYFRVALGCEPGQSRHHLLVALGALSLSLGEWPVERFAATAQRYLTFVEGAE